MVADTAAASILQYLDENAEALELEHIGISMMDNKFISGVYPEQTLPFEYAPGQFVNPDDADYLSTVYFTFINRIARQVKEKYPDIYVNTWAYQFAETPPRCDLEDNILVQLCLIEEDVSQPLDEPTGEKHQMNFNNLSLWIEKTPNIIPLNYHFCSKMTFAYERPIWDRMQGDFLYYAEHGLMGAMATHIGDLDRGFWFDEHGNLGRHSVYTQSDAWAMNTLSSWLYAKLAWDPMAEVDALIKEFCDKCYGDASSYMQEYYSLLEGCWHLGKESEVQTPTMRVEIPWATALETYIDSFIDNYDLQDQYGDVPERLMTALNNAWDAADDLEKERIRRLKENMEYILYYIENMEFPD
jgi:hypothetical protein